MPVMSNGQAQLKTQVPPDKFLEMVAAGNAKVEIDENDNPKFTINLVDPFSHQAMEPVVFVNLESDIQKEVTKRQEMIERLTAEKAQYQAILDKITEERAKKVG